MGTRSLGDPGSRNVVGFGSRRCICEAGLSIAAAVGPGTVTRIRVDHSFASRFPPQPFQPYAAALDRAVWWRLGTTADFGAPNVVLTALDVSTRTDMTMAWLGFVCLEL